MSDWSELLDFISQTNFTAEFIYKSLSLIGGDLLLTANPYLISHKDNFEKPKDLYAILKMHLISIGRSLHQPFSYDNAPVNNYLDSITVGNNYQQFSDILSILSEYNSQTDVLDKYLRIYHILENFMFRLPLVNLEALANGKIFRIRDFRMMYERIEKSEPSALADLMKGSLKLVDSNGILLKKALFKKWELLKSIPGFDMVEINDYLKNIRIKLLISLQISNDK